jgi:hypothetical protein
VTVKSTTATAHEAIDEVVELLAPASERLVEAAGQVRDSLRDTVAPQVFEVATQVRAQGVPKVADKVAEVLSSAAERVGAHGTSSTRSGGFRWKPLALGAGAVAGALVVARVVRARRAADAGTHGARKFPSERPNEQEITDPTEAKLKETLDHAKEAVSQAVDAAASKPTDPKNTVTDLSDHRSDSGS